MFFAEFLQPGHSEVSNAQVAKSKTLAAQAKTILAKRHFAKLQILRKNKAICQKKGYTLRGIERWLARFPANDFK
jgi:hypothetical protein